MSLCVWNHGLIASQIDDILVGLVEEFGDILVLSSNLFDSNSIRNRNKTSPIINRLSFATIPLPPVTLTKYAPIDLRKIEEKYDFYFADVIKADRHYGRSFVTGAVYAESKLIVNYEVGAISSFIVFLLDFFENLFDQYKVQIFHLEVASLITKAASIVARSKNIKIRIPHSSRYKNYYFFADSEYISFKKKYHEFDKSNQRHHIVNTEDLGYDGARLEIQKYLRYQSAYVLLKNLTLQVYFFYAKNLRKINTYASYTLRGRLKTTINYYLGLKRLLSVKYSSLEECSSSNIVFFPLQLEPESALMVMSPDFSNQLYLIELISTALPADWCLVVKEHPLAIGTRPSDFYDRASSFLNVRLVSPNESIEKLISVASIVAVINSSIGFDAAFNGKYVASFSNKNMINILEHVRYISSISEMRTFIRDIEQVSTGLGEEKRRRHGNNFLNHIIDNSFKLGENNSIDPIHYANALRKSIL